jgi:hypothetical protein
MKSVYFACSFVVVMVGVHLGLSRAPAPCEPVSPPAAVAGEKAKNDSQIPGGTAKYRAGTVALALPESGRTLSLRASLEPAEVLEVETTAEAGGSIRRRALVRTAGHFGDLIVEDRVDADGKIDPDRRIITSAEHLVVSAPELAPAETAAEICEQIGFDLLWEYRRLPLMKVRVAERSLKNFDDLLKMLKSALNDVPVHVEPDFLQPGALCAATPDDPLFPNQWALPKIGAPEAWEIPTDPAAGDILVCIIDSGIDLDHPDLQDNLWTYPGEIDGDRIDNDGNGFIDDVHGYNFAENYIDPDDPDDSDLFPPDDDLYHGSFCSGIIGAVTDNAIGIAGVCRRVKLVALKASEWDDVYGIDIAASMHYARMLHDAGFTVAAVSISMGIYNGTAIIEAMQDGMDALEAAGIPVCCSAGNANRSRLSYPARFTNSNLITVGASAPDDSPWQENEHTGTNYHPTLVHLAAPGQDIESTVPTFFWGDDDKDGYATSTGTSFSTPMVAGACAVLKAIHPDLDGLEIRNIILNTTHPVSAWQGMCLTEGRLDLAAAARSALAARNFQATPPSREIHGPARLDWQNLGDFWDYTVRIAPAPGGPWTPAPGTWPIQETTWTDSAAAGETQRFYRVEAVPQAP